MLCKGLVFDGLPFVDAFFWIARLGTSAYGMHQELGTCGIVLEFVFAEGSGRLV